MRELLLKWLINTISLFAVMHIVTGVSVDRLQSLLAAALVISLLNAFLRPLIILFTLPVNLLTLGLFTLVINGFLFYLAAFMVTGFKVAGFGNAMLASIVFSILSLLLNLLIRFDR